MPLETYQWFKDFVLTNPEGTDPKSQGDDHFRGVKTTIVNQFPNFTGEAVTLTEAEINALGGLTQDPPITHNLLINPEFTINQRAWAGGVPADNVYGFDRWAGADAGVNIRQIVELTSIGAGIYTLSWVGGGNGFIGATTGPSPLEHDFVTAPVADVEIKIPAAATLPQFNQGANVVFERRSIGAELVLCQRYYWSMVGSEWWAAQFSTHPDDQRIANLRFPERMRAIPTVVVTHSVTVWKEGPTETELTAANVRYKGEPDKSDDQPAIATFTADAELYNP